jgi:hypothetical protein
MVKKVKTMISNIEQRTIKPVEIVLEEVKEKKPRKPRTKKVEDVLVIENVKVPKAEKEVKPKRQLSTLQLAYNKYKSDCWLQYKAKGTSFKNMLQDEKFKNGWAKLKTKM